MTDQCPRHSHLPFAVRKRTESDLWCSHAFLRCASARSAHASVAPKSVATSSTSPTTCVKRQVCGSCHPSLTERKPDHIDALCACRCTLQNRHFQGCNSSTTRRSACISRRHVRAHRSRSQCLLQLSQCSFACAFGCRRCCACVCARSDLSHGVHTVFLVALPLSGLFRTLKARSAKSSCGRSLRQIGSIVRRHAHTRIPPSLSARFVTEPVPPA